MSKSRFLTEADEIYSMTKARSLVTYGDIKQDDDLSNQTVKELMKKILQPYRKPDISGFSLKTESNVSISNVYEKSSIISNSVNTLKVSFTSKYWSNLLKTYTVNISGKTYNFSTVNDVEKSDYTITHSAEISNVNISNNNSYDNDNSYSITVTGNDGKTNSISIGSKTVSFIRPYILFVADTNNASDFNFETNILPKIEESIEQKSTVYSSNSSTWNKYSNELYSCRIVSSLAVNSSFTFEDKFSNRGETSKIMIIAIPSNKVKNGILGLLNEKNLDVEFTNIGSYTGANGVSYTLFKSLETKFESLTYKIKSMS